MTFTLPPWGGRRKRKPRDPNPHKLPPEEDAKRRQLGLPGLPKSRTPHPFDDDQLRPRRSRRR